MALFDLPTEAPAPTTPTTGGNLFNVSSVPKAQSTNLFSVPGSVSDAVNSIASKAAPISIPTTEQVKADPASAHSQLSGLEEMLNTLSPGIQSSKASLDLTDSKAVDAYNSKVNHFNNLFDAYTKLHGIIQAPVSADEVKASNAQIQKQAAKNTGIGNIIKNTIFGLPKAAWDFIGVGKIQDYLSTPEGQSAAANLTGKDIAKNIIPETGKFFGAPIADVAGIFTGPKTYNVPLVGKISNIQQQTKDAVMNGENPYIAIVNATPQSIFDGLMVAGLADKVFSPRESVIAKGKAPATIKYDATTNKEGALTPLKTADQSFRLTKPIQSTSKVLPKEAIDTLIEQGYKLKGYDPSKPSYFKVTPKIDGSLKGEIIQLKPSLFDVFRSKFGGNIYNVPPAGLTIVHEQDRTPAEIRNGLEPETNKPSTQAVTPEALKEIVSRIQTTAKPTQISSKLAVGSDILVGRHGDIDKVEDGIAHGQTSDPLNPEGIKDAEKLGQEWKAQGVRNIVSSDLTRGKQTADITAKIAGATVKYDPRLRTWDIGNFNGKPKSEVDPQLQHYRDNPTEVVPGGESFKSFTTRVTQGLNANKAPGTAFVLHNEILKTMGHAFETGETKTIPFNGQGIDQKIKPIDNKTYAGKGNNKSNDGTSSQGAQYKVGASQGRLETNVPNEIFTRKVSENISGRSEASQLDIGSARELSKGNIVEIKPATLDILRAGGFSDELLTKLQTAVRKGGVTKIALTPSFRGMAIEAAYSADTLYLNSDLVDDPNFKDGSIINHEINGHAWYIQLSGEGRKAFYENMKGNKDMIRQSWIDTKNDHVFYWNKSISEIEYTIAKGATQEVAADVLRFVGLNQDDNISLDTFIDRSLNFDKSLIAINAELERRGIPAINLKAEDIVANMEHNAVIAENSPNLTANDNDLVGRYVGDIQNQSIKFGDSGALALAYPGEMDLTLKTLEKLKGRTTVSKTFISDLSNSSDLKQQERDIIRQALETEGDTVNVPEFTAKVQAELLPLSRDSLKNPKYEFVGLKGDTRGSIKNYRENVYNSPIKTSAGQVHFSDNGIGSLGISVESGGYAIRNSDGDVEDVFPTEQEAIDALNKIRANAKSEGYFGHTRVEDMADDSTRRVIEVQSDLYQKGNLEKELPIIGDKAIFKDKEYLLSFGSTRGWYKLKDKNGDYIEAKQGEVVFPELQKNIAKLSQYNDPTAHFRMVREEIKQAAKEGKTALQFPTGETAMKIEGLGQVTLFRDSKDLSKVIKPEDLKIGKGVNTGGQDWIITDVLGDGKFKAISKERWDNFIENLGGKKFLDENGLPSKKDIERANFNYSEQFDISGKVDTNNPIYRFYEKDLGRYLKNNYGAKPVTDAQGVTWYEVPIKPEMAKEPVTAFRVPKNPKFDTGNKLEDARAALAHVESRVGVKPTDIQQLTRQLEREQLSLEAAKANPEMHKKAYGEDRQPKHEAKIKELKSRIETAKKNLLDTVQTIKVSDKEVPLPEDLQMREVALEFKREEIENSPLKPLLKYVQKRGDFAGQLPEVTGDKTSKSKFMRQGEQILQEAIPHGDTYETSVDSEQVREEMDKYLEKRREFQQEQQQLKEDQKAYVKSVKDEIALDKLGQKNAKVIEREINKVQEEKKKQARALEIKTKEQKAEIEAKEKKYGFTVPAYDEKSPLYNIPELISQEDAIKKHPANPFMKYVNNRTGLLPEIDTKFPGVYGEKMTTLLKAHDFSSVAEAQKAVDNFLAQVKVLEQATEDKFAPIEMVTSPSVTETNAFELEKKRLNTPGAQPFSTMMEQSDKLPVNKKVGELDFWRTPKRVLKKIGLEDESKLIKKKYYDYAIELPKNIQKITDWSMRVPQEGSARRIFDYLDGAPGEGGFTQPDFLSGNEYIVGNEIKAWLEEWADRLKLKKHERLSNYITHIFEDDLIKKEFDPELAKIIQDKIAGQVYDPFLEKRLGQLGYVHDVWRALDAYVKRATRKVHMDEALEKVKIASRDLDVGTANYIKKYIDGVNLRPTQKDNYIDNSIKQLIGYRLGQRPFARITRIGRQMVFRGTLGLNVGSALKNLTQGVNTFAMLGTKYTSLGYAKLLNGLNHQELEDEGILSLDIIQDRTLSSTKKFFEKADKAFYFMFETVEKINRGAAYFGAKAKYYAENSRTENGIQVWNAGSSEQEARYYAREFVEDTQFTFSSVDTPVALQSDMAKTLGQFQSFNIKQAEFLIEMARNKNYMGIIRYIFASLAVLIGIGKLFGMKWQDMIPFSRYSLPPLIALPIAIAGAIMGTPDQFGNVPSVSQRFANIGRTLVPFIPAGVQGNKTIAGATSIKQGETNGISEDAQAVLFGPKNITANVVSKKLNASIKTAQTKLDALDQTIKDAVQPVFDQAKQLGFGTPEADAAVSKLSKNEMIVYKAMFFLDVAKNALTLEPKILPIVQKVKMLGAGTPEADALVKNLSKPEMAVYKSIYLSLYGTELAAGNSAADVTGTWNQQSLITKISNIAKAVGTDPVTLFSDLIGGDYKVTGLKNGQIIVDRNTLKEAATKKALGGNSSLILDHLKSLELGGTNQVSNMWLIPKDQSIKDDRVENYLGKALKDGKITGKQAQELEVRYKKGADAAYIDSRTKKLFDGVGSALTFDQIKQQIGG